MDDGALMGARSWRWLRVRIAGLLDVPPTVSPDGQVIHATRLAFALDPPKPPK